MSISLPSPSMMISFLATQGKRRGKTLSAFCDNPALLPASQATGTEEWNSQTSTLASKKAGS
jgi:hypothetical protein